MANHTKRPMFLNLLQIHLPITGWVSILHRISGLGIFILLPCALCTLSSSLASVQKFDLIKSYFTSPVAAFFAWAFLAGFVYHLIAGVRHMLMDLGFGVSYPAARKTATVTIIVALIICAIIGWKIFGGVL